MAREKTELLTVRATPATLLDFKTVARIRGGSMSVLVHQWIVRAIREEKERDPDGFERTRQQTAKAAPTLPIPEYSDQLSSRPQMSAPGEQAGPGKKSKLAEKDIADAKKHFRNRRRKKGG